MNYNFLGSENVTLSLEIFNFIKNISALFIDYLKQYHFISVEYHQKLLLINTTYKNKISSIFDKIKKKNIDISKVFEFVNSIPKIIDARLESLLFFNGELNEKIRVFEDNSIDQVISTCEAQFNKLKNNLTNKDNDINNIKNNFFSEMKKTELITYKYYFLNKKFNSNIPEKYKNEHIKEEEMNNIIKETKEIENNYKQQIEEGKNMENIFKENLKFYSENIKKCSNDLIERIKNLVLNFVMALKNNFKLPENEINIFLPKLIKLNETLNLDETFKNHFIFYNKGISLFNPEKYEMLIFQKTKKKKENKEIIDEIENKILELEDGFETTYLILDPISFFTIEKMKIFELININNLNLEIEREKLKINELIDKLLSNIKKDPKEVEQTQLNISQDELNLIEILLNQHHNIIIFIQKLNKFRVSGKFYISKEIFSILEKYFIQILNVIKNDEDMFTAKNIMILSQTYFKKDGEKKIYLQETIQKHEIFKQKKFWENLFTFFMNKEIQKLRKSIDLNDIIEQGKNNYNKLAFGQIMSICNNMIEFGLDKNEIYEILEPKIKYYDLDENSIKGIKEMLGLEEENNNK